MDADQLPRVMETLAALSDHETSLARLYAACGHAWSDDAALWRRLADSERDHAKCLAEMARIVAERPAAFQVGRPFTAAAGRLQAGYVENRTREVRRGGMARRTALLMARAIERSIMETRLDELLRTEERDYLAIAERVAAETAVHYRLLERELQGASATRGTQTSLTDL
jgi:hypothetical protein